MTTPEPVDRPDKHGDPGAFDVANCDQFGVDGGGKPIADELTGPFDPSTQQCLQ